MRQRLEKSQKRKLEKELEKAVGNELGQENKILAFAVIVGWGMMEILLLGVEKVEEIGNWESAVQKQNDENRNYSGRIKEWAGLAKYIRNQFLEQGN